MLQELSDESRRMGLKMNIAKTKVMIVDNNVNNVLIENVQGYDRYVYFGQRYSIKERTRTKRYNEESWQAGRHKPNTGIPVSFESNSLSCK